MIGQFTAIEMGDCLWEETLERTDADIFYRPEFCRFRLEGTPFRPLMLRYEDNEGLVFDVSVVKKISSLPFFSSIADEIESNPVDLASVEYNGPIIIAAAEKQLAVYHRYREAVDQFCRESGVVTEFVRIHPFFVLAGELANELDLKKVGEVIYVDLRQGYEAAFRGYRKGHKAAAKRAARDGAEIRFVPSEGQAIETFTKLYLDTMIRNNAKSYCFYKLEYFRALFQQLAKRTLLVESYFMGKIASSAIFLLGAKHVWYFYAGLVPELRSSCANNLLIDRMIRWSAEQGFDFLVLGGGLQPGDGMYKNKLGYSHLMLSQFHYRKIHDPRMFERLESAKADYDQSLGKITRKDYFPSYWLE